MDELKRMTKEICLITLGLTLILMMGSVVLFPTMRKSVSLGIGIGSLTGVLGFVMIVRMAKSMINAEEDEGSRAYQSQMRRYLLYGGVIAICIWRGGNVFALLAGILAHKASILIYTWRHRKEDD